MSQADIDRFKQERQQKYDLWTALLNTMYTSPVDPNEIIEITGEMKYEHPWSISDFVYNGEIFLFETNEERLMTTVVDALFDAHTMADEWYDILNSAVPDWTQHLRDYLSGEPERIRDALDAADVKVVNLPSSTYWVVIFANPYNKKEK